MSRREKAVGILALAAVVFCLYLGRDILRQSRRIEDLKLASDAARERADRLGRERDALRKEASVAPVVVAPAPAPAEPAPVVVSSPPPVEPTPARPPSRIVIGPAVLTKAPIGSRGSLAVVGDDGARLNEEFVRSFNLTAEERGALEGALNETSRRLLDLSMANASFSVAGSTANVMVSPFPEGEAVRADLLRRFETVLGPERIQLFMTHYSEDPLYGALGNFGLRQRHIGISRLPNGYTTFDQKFSNTGTFGRAVPTLRDLRLSQEVQQLLAPFAKRLEETFGEPLAAP